MWGADITPDDNPYEAGLGFAVKAQKPGGFIGDEALVEAGEPLRRLVAITLDEPRAVALGNEPVRIAGEIAGRVTSGGFGYTVGESIALAYVPAGVSEVGTPVEIDIFGEWVAGTIVREPLYDPAGERLRA